MGTGGAAGDRDSEAESGPLRLCAVSRAHKPPEELIRFVAGPDGVIVPDLARRLPGRGVWVDATRPSVAAAVRKKAFARSLKRHVTVPADLPDLVERLLAKRLADAVSIANKAGLLVAGFTKVDELIARESAAILIHAADAAVDGVAKLDRKFKALPKLVSTPERIIRELTGAELSLAMGRPNVIHAAAAEGGASHRLIEEARRLRRYRLGEAPGGCRPSDSEPTQDVHD
jgi:predicted RNA-binding protein YlxR (DUF448 family)